MHEINRPSLSNQTDDTLRLGSDEASLGNFALGFSSRDAVPVLSPSDFIKELVGELLGGVSHEPLAEYEGKLALHFASLRAHAAALEPTELKEHAQAFRNLGCDSQATVIDEIVKARAKS